MLITDAAHRAAGQLLLPFLGRKLQRFFAQTHCVRSAATERLMSIVASAAGSRFGRDHRFADIRSVADFRCHVPIASYEYHAPYVERLKLGQRDALFNSRRRVLMFALTSGITAEPKYIPVTSDYVQAYRDG